MNAPGKGMLQVVSILYIVFGGIFALFMLLSLFAASMFAFMADFGGLMGTAMTGVLFIIFLIPAAVDLVIGIIGLKQCKDPSKSLFFIVTGFILGGLTFFGIFSNPLLTLISLVMPVLFIVGGFMNKNANKSAA